MEAGRFRRRCNDLSPRRYILPDARMTWQDVLWRLENGAYASNSIRKILALGFMRRWRLMVAKTMTIWHSLRYYAGDFGAHIEMTSLRNVQSDSILVNGFWMMFPAIRDIRCCSGRRRVVGAVRRRVLSASGTGSGASYIRINQNAVRNQIPQPIRSLYNSLAAFPVPQAAIGHRGRRWSHCGNAGGSAASNIWQ